ncbi:MAG: phosphoribosylamine--glycine ligase [Fimbriimonadaceae bacterium]|nr:phosphoribosylamine--glycine ligase [Fimbriimonadaceae bacterium]
MARILVVGSGGREHALAWKLAQEAEVWATPGNPGIRGEAETFDVKANDAAGLAELAKRGEVDAVLFGPEDPLIAGCADHLRGDGIAVFGPGKDAARLEGSKAFSKDLMRSARVPTASFGTFRDPEAALGYVQSRADKGRQVVVKASGAALGKGVVVCHSPDEAEDAIQMMLVDRELGEAGSEVVIEDRLVGREFSLMTLVSNGEIRSLPVAQDYKRALDGDRGPNTGGMGSYAPADWVSTALIRETEERVVRPILAALKAKGMDYRGVLFSGLLVEEDVPYCLEYNVRFGDPETQSIVRCLGNGFADAILACARGDDIAPIQTLDHHAVTVVLASGGYPGRVAKGTKIALGPMPEGVVVFHAGTSIDGDNLVSAGGRVLGISAIGSSTEAARDLAYQGVTAVQFDRAHFRHDIGHTLN